MHGRQSGRAALLLGVALVGAVGCAEPHQARLSTLDPTSAREQDAMLRHASSECDVVPVLGFVVSGLPLACSNRTAEGAALTVIADAELVTGIAFWAKKGIDYPGSYLPLLAFQDTAITGIASGRIDNALSEQALFAPQDTLAEVALAPWNGRVLRRPEVWLGTLFFVGAGIAVDQILGANWNHLGEGPNIFGRQFTPETGYPLGLAVNAAVVEQVAVAEESYFRGVVQSAFARRAGENAGWIYGSLVFGGVHSLNAAFASSPSDAAKYLGIGVPYITLVGAYLGWVYKRDGYSLAPSTAIHFWYDFLTLGIEFVRDPKHSPLSASVVIPW